MSASCSTTAGLRLLTARGQRRGGALRDALDEDRDRKAFLLATHA